jgi:hypothetical protein
MAANIVNDQVVITNGYKKSDLVNQIAYGIKKIELLIQIC